MSMSPRRVVSALALLTAIGCGGGDESGPTGSIQLSASPSALTLQQGGTGTVTVTLVRGGGFANPVNVTVTGLPSGVTLSVDPAQLTGTTTLATVTVTVANTVPAGTYTATVTGTATGIGSATASYTLTVTALPTYALTATPAAVSVGQGGSGTTTIGVQRTNFTAPVTLTLENPPAGITGSFNPAPATGDQSVLTINVASTVATGNVTLTVKGTATGQPDKTTTVALTVTPPPNYTLSTTPSTLTIAAGGNSTTTVNIARTNFTGAVTLSLSSPPAGITATFNPAAPTGNTSTATISVAANVAPGNYNVTILGAASGVPTFNVAGEIDEAAAAGDRTTTVAVTVTAAASFTISASPTAVSAAPGGNTTTSVAIVRTNFTTDVALTLVNPPAGITGVFTPATLTGATLTSSLQINVAGTVQPGSYPVTVQGAGGSLTQTTVVTVTVTAAGSVTLSVSPTSVTIQQGQSGQVTLNANRNNFTGNITPSVTGNPSGMTFTFNPNPITGTQATVTVNVGASVPVATHTVTITGAAGSAGNPTTTLAVVVTAATGGSNINWDFCTADGVPIKFWRQSGGTWAEVTSTVVGQVTRFSFTVSGATGGVAYTFQTSSAILRSRSAPSKLSGAFSKSKQARERMQTMQRLANQTLPQQSTSFDTFVRFGTAAELTAYATAQGCLETMPRVSKTFNVTGMGSGESGILGYGPGSASLSPTTPSYNVMVAPGNYDWAAGFGTPSGFPPSFTPTAYRLGRNEAAPGAAVNINRTGATAFSTSPFTISGAAGGSLNAFFEFISGSRGSIVGFSVGPLFSSATSGDMLFFASADRLPTDLVGFLVNNFAQTSATTIEARTQLRYFGAPPASTTFTLPSTVPAFTVTQPGGLWSVTGSIPTEYQTATSPITFNVEGNGGNASLQIDATRGWLVANGMSTTYTLAQPTLPNFLSTYTPAAPFSAAGVFMLGYDELVAPSAGSVLNSGGRVQVP